MVLIYDDELGYVRLDPAAEGGIQVIAPPGAPPVAIPPPPAPPPPAPEVPPPPITEFPPPAPEEVLRPEERPTAVTPVLPTPPTAPPPPELPPDVEELSIEVDDDYAAELEWSRMPTEDELVSYELEILAEPEEEELRFLAARDPRIRHGGGVDDHLSRALGCGACRFAGPRDMRGAGRACALRCWQSNNAIDIMAPPGYAVRATGDGQVHPNMGYGLLATRGGTAGYRLHVRHPTGMISWYQHLGPKLKAKGAPVKRGDVLGYIARWPDFDPHVHFAVSSPFNPEHYWEAVVTRTGRDVPTAAPPRPRPPIAPEPLDPPKRRTLEKAWLDLMDSRGGDRRDRARRIAAARKAIREAIR